MSRVNIVPGAGGVVFHKDKVLVLEHKNGEHVFAKGHVDEGETLLEAAVREVEEEAGVVGVCDNPELTYHTKYANNKGVERDITWFLLETEADTPILREKTFPGGAFMTPEKARETLSFDEDKALLEYMLNARASQ